MRDKYDDVHTAAGEALLRIRKNDLLVMPADRITLALRQYEQLLLLLKWSRGLPF